ncbi:MAG: four helix bundle protein [Patescibacteria group bacterium]
MNYGTIRAERIRVFTDLDAWKEGHTLVLMVYKGTATFPKEETFGLVSQMRRCVVSITSNIAEGFSRQSYKEKAHFYSMAQGSVTELQNQLFIAKDVGYLTKERFQEMADQATKVHKIINGLIKMSKARNDHPHNS